jgi:ubiquitin-conjugating enzyme E2 D/E
MASHTSGFTKNQKMSPHIYATCEVKTWHFCKMFQVRLDGRDCVYRLPISRNATVLHACQIVRDEFAIKTPFEASVYGSELNRSQRLFSLIRPEDVVLIKSAKETPLEFATDVISLGPIPDGNFRLFTNLSWASMTKGNLISISNERNARDCHAEIVKFLRQKCQRLPDDIQMQILLPGGAVFEETGKKLCDFFASFPKARRHLYAVVTRRIPENDLSASVKEVCCLSESNPDMRNLLDSNPWCRASGMGLSTIACLLGYFQRVGPVANAIIYSISKIIPFAPLINGLRLLLAEKKISASMITHITAPLYTIFSELLGRNVPGEKVFEECLKCLPFLSQFRVRYIPEQTTFFKHPYQKIGFEVFFEQYRTQIIPMLDSDFRGWDVVQLCPPRDEGQISRFTIKFQEFQVCAIMAARRENRVRFMDLKDSRCLFLRANAAKGEERQDKITILAPKDGVPKQWDPEDLVKRCGPEEHSKIVDLDEVRELIMVCVDTSGSMTGHFGNGLNRLDAAKRLFQAFANQARHFHIDNYYGLIQFSDRATLLLDLQPLPGNFGSSCDRMGIGGRTALWGAMNLALDHLNAAQARHRRPNGEMLPIRIIALTDGQETDPQSFERVARRLFDARVRIDAIFVSRSEELLEAKNLLTMARMTGGSFFLPSDIDAGKRIFENEAFFDFRCRAYGEFQSVFSPNSFFNSLSSAKRGPDLAVEGRPIANRINMGGRLANPGWILNRKAEPEALRDYAIFQQLKLIARNADPQFQVYVVQDRIHLWRVAFMGPCYENEPERWLEMVIEFGDSYPGTAPIVTLVSKIYHRSISDLGRLFLPSIQEGYDGTMKVYEIICEVTLLIANPQIGGVADPAKQRQFETDRGRYDEEEKKSVRNSGLAVNRPTKEMLEGRWGVQIDSEDWNGGDDNDDDHVRDIPRQFCCPIKKDRMDIPVYCERTKRYYDKDSLRRLLDEENPVCPDTGIAFNKVEDGNLQTDLRMKQLIDAWIRNNT